MIGGCHSDIKSPVVKFSPQAAAARIARIKVIPDISFEEVKFATSAHVKLEAELTPNFWECEGMGVLPPRKCLKC